jgi:hypothetical protein
MAPGKYIYYLLLIGDLIFNLFPAFYTELIGRLPFIPVLIFLWVFIISSSLSLLEL